MKHVREFPANDSRNIWRNIRRYLDVDLVTRAIIARHGLSEKQKGNARKQARQIRQSLKQAEEYFLAAKSVSLATQPVLLYYGVMSLAIAEYLFKQDGNSSLDLAREKHSHHGLEFSVARIAGLDRTLAQVAQSMRAKPHMRSGEHRGTFELWHRSAREYSLAGVIQTVHQNHTVKGIEIWASATDTSLTKVPETGLSLAQCFESLPFLGSSLAEFGLRRNFARATATSTRDFGTNTYSYKLVIHPGRDETIAAVSEKILFPAETYESLSVTEFSSGCQIILRVPIYDPKEFQIPTKNCSYPGGVQYEVGEFAFYADDLGLNEFGIMYMAVYMLGNYARYYPDLWMNDVENSSDLATITDHFLNELELRAPTLFLSTITDTLLLNRQEWRWL